MRRRSFRAAIVFCLFAAAYYFAFHYSMSFSQACASPFWLPDSVLLCALLSCAPGQWWIFVLGTLPLRIFVSVDYDVPFWFVLATCAIDAGKGLASAMVLRRFLKNQASVQTVREFAAFCLCAVLAVAGGAALAGATARQQLGHDYWTAWEQWFLGNATTQLVVTPGLLFWAFGASWDLRALTPGRVIEGVVVAVGLAATGYFAFTTKADFNAIMEPRFYAPAPFLFWAAIRFGMHGATGAVVIITFFSVHAALLGRGPFSVRSPDENALALQYFLLLRAAPVYLVAILTEQHDRTEATLRDSEERYRTLVEAQTDLICRFLPDTTLTFVNEACCHFFGRRRDELLGQRLLNLIPAAHHDYIKGKLKALPQPPYRIDAEHEIVTRDGELRWLNWINIAIVDESGCMVAIQGIGRDITERRRNELALRESEQRFRDLADAAPGLIWIAGADRRCSYMSRRWLDFLGPGLKESERDGWMAGVHPDDLPLCVSSYAAAFDARRPFDHEFRRLRIDGKYRWMLVHAIPRWNATGEFLGYIGSCLDTTQRKHDEMEIQQNRQELMHLSRASSLGVLASALAHELNQPLAAILSNSQAALRYFAKTPPDLAEVNQILPDIAAEAGRAGEVIHRVRALLARAAPQFLPVDLNELASDVVGLMRSELMHRGTAVDIVRAIDLGEPLGDHVPLQQVLINLVLNACDAMQHLPAPERRILVRTMHREGAHAIVAVSDCGVGLKPGEVDRLFSPFFTTKRYGLGVGLAICKSVVEAHGGRIWAENNAERGATFYVALPLGGDAAPSPSRAMAANN